jgi:hypothetical protein
MRRFVVGVALAAILAGTGAFADAAKPRRTPRPTPAPTPVVALSPMPVERGLTFCLRVTSAADFVSPRAFADAIARGAALVTNMIPCPSEQLPPDPTAAPTPTVVPTPRPTSAPTPAGTTSFVWAADPTISWRWLDDGEFSCDYDGAACWGMLVTASAGCPRGLYAEVTILDRSKVAIGYTNDTVGALNAGQQARLVFESFDEGATYAQPSDLSCH